MPTYAITMLAAGIGIPVLAAMNAALGRYLGAPMLAGAMLLAVGFLTAFHVATVVGFTCMRCAPIYLSCVAIYMVIYLCR